jgi:hypothetical protein
MSERLGREETRCSVTKSGTTLAVFLDEEWHHAVFLDEEWYHSSGPTLRRLVFGSIGIILVTWHLQHVTTSDL